MKLERRGSPLPAVDYPRCTKAKGVCPFDDSGGPWGWEEKLKIVRDPTHPEYADIREWMGVESGEDFDPSDYAMSPEGATEMMRDAEEPSS